MSAAAEQAAAEFDIDLRRLHEEWRGQAQRVYNAAAHAAAVEKTYAEAKAALKRKAAQLGQDFRKNPDVYGLSKTTDAVISDAVISDPEYRNAEQKMIDAKYALDMAYATSDALEHRKKSLEKIVDLWLREYFSEPLPRGRSTDGDELNREDASRRMLENSRSDRGGS